MKTLSHRATIAYLVHLHNVMSSTILNVKQLKLLGQNLEMLRLDGKVKIIDEHKQVNRKQQQFRII